MQARGEYVKSKRDSNAVLEGDRQKGNSKEKCNTITGVRNILIH